MRRAHPNRESDRSGVEESRAMSQAMTPHALPRSILENPLLAQWVDFSEPGVVRVFSAKVELGQGIVTAIAQIAAEELRLPIAQVVVVSGDTRYCPDESYTAGSISIEIGGNSMWIACADRKSTRLNSSHT